MTSISKPPYFLKNNEWFKYDFELGTYVLSEKAPPKAVKSYKDFYKMLNESYNTKEVKIDFIKPNRKNKIVK
jgi:hypothetical protein